MDIRYDGEVSRQGKNNAHLPHTANPSPFRCPMFIRVMADTKRLMRLLDLFCGAGGAAMGYHRAGFDQIVGIDNVPQPDYPFEFIQADAIEYMALQASAPDLLRSHYALIHASPPCQAFTTMSNRARGMDRVPRWPDLLGPTRKLLNMFDIPFVIENVPGARRRLHNPVELTGEMFGLAVHRPRLFQLGGWSALVPHKPPSQKDPIAIYGKPDGRRLWDRKDGTQLRAWTLEQGREAMGMPWVTDELGIREAIPPAYTEYLGRQFLDQLARL